MQASKAALRVLFVDDEQNLLDGLRRALHRQRGVWEMEFVTSGEDALERLAADGFDVVVSDMRMPEMNGMELLKRVRLSSPDTCRIVLSGQTELQGALRSASVAQGFLHKPCEPDALISTVLRTVSLVNELSSSHLRHVVSSLEMLPSPPRLIHDLNECLSREDLNLDRVTEIISQDGAIVAKLLQLANSAIFGLVREITEIRDALTIVGLANIRDLAVASSLFRSISEKASQVDRVREIEERSLLAANVAGALCGDGGMTPSVFTAVLLHDIGILLIAASFPNEDVEIQACIAGGEDRLDVERMLLGVDHAQLGAHLLQLWGIPHDVVEVAARHHVCPAQELWTKDALNVVYLTDCVLARGVRVCEFVPEGFIEAVGCADTLQDALDLL